MKLNSIDIFYLDSNGEFLPTTSKLNNIDYFFTIFKKYGCILFKNLYDNQIEPRFIADLFTLKYANDALRRINTKEQTSKSFVETSSSINLFPNGNNAVSWHSEAHFSPSYPDAIFLYCHSIEKGITDGKTLICDGVKVWDELNIEQKNYFLKNQVLYKASIILSNTLPKKKITWYIPEPGCFDVILDGKNNILSYSLIRNLINKCSNSKLSFCNYLLHHPWEPQLESMEIFPNFDYNTVINKESLEKIISKFQISHKWNPGDLLMIDNKRFMHAREAYHSNSRVIELIQALNLRK